jgi:hypothetical protein
MHIFRHIFLSNYWWQKSCIWSQASYRYPISWEASLNPSDSYFLFADFIDFSTHICSMCIKIKKVGKQEVGIRWVQKRFPRYGVPIWSLYIWSQASYKYPISWEAFSDPSDSYFLFADFVDFYTHLTLTTIWHTYMKLVTKYQIPVINSCREKCNKKCAYTNVC